MSECSRTYRQGKLQPIFKQRSKKLKDVRLVVYAVTSVTTDAVIKAPKNDGRCTLTPPVCAGFGAPVLVVLKDGHRWREERVVVSEITLEAR